MFREPGPLTKEDREEIKAFQMANDLLVDGKIGSQTKDAIWARMAMAGTAHFNLPAFLVGGLVFGILAAIFL